MPIYWSINSGSCFDVEPWNCYELELLGGCTDKTSNLYKWGQTYCMLTCGICKLSGHSSENSTYKIIFLFFSRNDTFFAERNDDILNYLVCHHSVLAMNSKKWYWVSILFLLLIKDIEINYILLYILMDSQKQLRIVWVFAATYSLIWLLAR